MPRKYQHEGIAHLGTGGAHKIYEIGRSPVGFFEVGPAGTFGKTSVNEWGQTVHPRYLDYTPVASGTLAECRRGLKKFQSAAITWAAKHGERLPQDEVERIIIEK